MAHDYKVEIRDVDGTLHTFLGPGRRVVTGSPPIVDEAEVDLGEYGTGKTVFRTYTYSTDAEPGTWGDWQYSATVPDEDETFVIWPVATTTDGVPSYHNVGMIRILDIKLCQSCA